jgi:hypothetical protein
VKWAEDWQEQVNGEMVQLRERRKRGERETMYK